MLAFSLAAAQVHELSANPHVEVCWYFPSSREQYRLSGTATIVQLDHSDEQLLQSRQQAWAAMSDAGTRRNEAEECACLHLCHHIMWMC